MVESGTVDLLSHPLSQKFMQHKWDSFGKTLFFINLLFYIIFMLSLTIYIANSATGSTQDSITTQDNMYKAEQAQRYLPISTKNCPHTQVGPVHLVYLSGHLKNTSKVFSLKKPCNSVKYAQVCRRPTVGALLVFTASQNESCSALFRSKSPHLIGCKISNSSSDYLVIEEHGSVKNCTAYTYNSTCELNGGVLGVIYSDSENITGYCNSPHGQPKKGTAATATQTILIIQTLFHFVKELAQVLAQGSDYRWVDSLLDWALYGTSLVFVWPGQLSEQPSDWQWQCGAVAVCLAWLNTILFLRRFTRIGIYIVMFLSVLRTFVEAFAVFFVLMVAFGLSFYILFSGQDTFNSIGISILHVGVMLIGEVDFEDILFANADQVHYKGVSYAIYSLFILLVPLVLMNFLVGLAVDDIEEVKKNAFMKRLAMQVNMISSVERTIPLWYRKRVYRRSLSVYPYQEISTFHKVMNFLNSLTSMNTPLGGGNDDKEEAGSTDQKLVRMAGELGRQKMATSKMQKQLDSMALLLRSIADHMKVPQENLPLPESLDDDEDDDSDEEQEYGEGTS